MSRWLTTLAVLTVGSLPAAEAPRVLELQTQKVDGTAYFHVRLERPADLRLPTFDTGKPFSEADRRKFAGFPRLVPQDARTHAVYYRHRPTQPGLSFRGQVTGGGKARFLLLYPTRETPAEKAIPLAELVRAPGTAEMAVEVDFGKARTVPLPAMDRDDQHIHRDNLRGNWALYQGAHFAVLETQVLDHAFFSFAREATGRKYGVVAPAWVRRDVSDPQHRLYEVTTGADALAETLQLHRLLRPEARPTGERTVPVTDVVGVTVPEQPWERLLGQERPKTEPIARLVPNNNYYIAFKDVRKFIEFGDLFEQWGGSILQVYEVKSRDLRLRERYEKQLCLKSTALGKALAPALVKGLAVTGSDPYVCEGTDITVIFHVSDSTLFLAAVDGFLKEARKEHGKRLIEGRDAYQGTTVERFVTPQREVSLHRATAGDFIIYSNSPLGVRRVLDAHAGRIKRLADADDFRYMRTIFPLGDKAEDGFLFLPDAFIRRLTGPATRIKEKRRLEALTSLYLLTNAALFSAWETGKLPADHAAALAGAGLRADDIVVPEGKGARWDAERQLAVSDAYNTIHFATPLIELPIDRVTPAEEKEYERFREEYSKLWRTYFDPVALRLSLDARKVQAEMHILPLAASEQYRALRQMVGNGEFRVEATSGSVVELRMSVGMKEAVSFHVGGGDRLREMIELLIRWEEGALANPRQEYDRVFWKMPLGVGLHSPLLEGMEVETVINQLKNWQLIDGEPKVSQHKDVKLYRLTIEPKKFRELAAFIDLALQQPQQQVPFAPLLSLVPREEAPEAVYLAVVDRGLHLSASEAHLKKLIDHAEARKKAGKKDPPGREANATMDIVPANGRDAVSRLLEYEGHCLSLLNNQVWNSLYQAGLLAADAPVAKQREVAAKFLGFVPVSADGSVYRYDVRRGEVVNTRHGSHRRPDWHGKVAEGSELGKFLDQVKALRAELRFLDNGLHTVVTIERR